MIQQELQKQMPGKSIILQLNSNGKHIFLIDNKEVSDSPSDSASSLNAEEITVALQSGAESGSHFLDALFKSSTIELSDDTVVDEDSNNQNGGDDAKTTLTSRYEGKLVLAERGQCMFEEKTLVAQRAGAKGVLIVNTDVSIYFCKSFRAYSPLLYC